MSNCRFSFVVLCLFVFQDCRYQFLTMLCLLFKLTSLFPDKSQHCSIFLNFLFCISISDQDLLHLSGQMKSNAGVCLSGGLKTSGNNVNYLSAHKGDNTREPIFNHQPRRSMRFYPERRHIMLVWRSSHENATLFLFYIVSVCPYRLHCSNTS